MKRSRGMCGVIRVDRLINQEVDMIDRVDVWVLKWFEQVESISGERLTERVYESEVKVKRVRGRQCTRQESDKEYLENTFEHTSWHISKA